MRAIMDTAKLKQIINAILPVTDTVKATFDEMGMTVKAIDHSHISLINLYAPKSDFTYYDCVETTYIGLDIEKLNESLKAMGSDTISMEYDTTTSRLNLMCGNLRRSMATVDVSTMTTMKNLDLVHNSKATFDTDDLKKILKVSSSISDKLKITIGNGSLSFIAENDNGEELQLTMNKSNMKEYTEEAQVVSSSLPYQYISSIIKTVPKTITLYLASDYPVMMSYKLNDTEICYILAPMVNTDE